MSDRKVFKQVQPISKLPVKVLERMGARAIYHIPNKWNDASIPANNVCNSKPIGNILKASA